MDWVNGKWFAPRPTPEEAARGIREFLDAIDLDATVEDAEMLDLLRPRQPDKPGGMVTPDEARLRGSSG